MDTAHRDRLAYVRVCSGVFERGTVVTHAATGKPFATKYAQQVFGRERETVDLAYPGDVVGLVNASALRVGDSLYVDEPVIFPPIPSFAPEHFAVCRAVDSGRYKQFRRGIEQLEQEGTVQVLRSDLRGDQAPVLAAVGPMQFEVAEHRMAGEFSAPVRLDRLEYTLARLHRPRVGARCSTARAASRCSSAPATARCSRCSPATGGCSACCATTPTPCSSRSSRPAAEPVRRDRALRRSLPVAALGRRHCGSLRARPRVGRSPLLLVGAPSQRCSPRSPCCCSAPSTSCRAAPPGARRGRRGAARAAAPAAAPRTALRGARASAASAPRRSPPSPRRPARAAACRRPPGRPSPRTWSPTRRAARRRRRSRRVRPATRRQPRTSATGRHLSVPALRPRGRTLPGGNTAR